MQHPVDTNGPSRTHKNAAQDIALMTCAVEYYKAFTRVCKDPASGDTALRFHKRNIVVIRKNGDIVLNTFGWYTVSTLSAMNGVLQALHITIQHQGPVTDGSWAVVQDGSVLSPYYDGMIIAATQAVHRKRGETVQRAYTRGSQLPAHTSSASHAATAALPPGSRKTLRQDAAGTTSDSAAPAAGQTQVPPQAAFTQELAQGEASYGSLHKQLQEAIAQMDLHDDSEGDDESLCVVCLHNPREEVLVPCGHMVLCSDCCEEVCRKVGECPLCREVIKDHCKL